VTGLGEQGSGRSLDELFSEIVRVRLAYEDTAETEERVNLRMRLDELRSEVAARPDTGLAGLADGELNERLRRVQNALDRLADFRMATGAFSAAGEAGGGLDPVQAMAHNRRVDLEGGRVDLEYEMLQIEEELRRRVQWPWPQSCDLAPVIPDRSC